MPSSSASPAPAAAPRQKPAEAVIAAFGGVRKTARMMNDVLIEAGRFPMHWTTVSHWRHRGGNIHPRWHRWILEAARRNEIPLTAEDLAWWEPQ